MKTHHLQGMCLAPVLLLGGCAAGPTPISSAETGCSPSETAISDYRSNTHPHTWTATCSDKTYHCTGPDLLKVTSCTQVPHK